MKKAIILAILVFTFSLTALAQNDSCAHFGWVEEKDKNGLNVRYEPNGEIIGKIPFAKEDGEQAIVKIIDYANGWLQIRNAETVDGKIVFQGLGWISAKKVTATVETNTGKPAPLYALPKRSSKKVGTIPNETLIKIVGFDCFGFKVSYKGKTGWLSADDTCGNPVTTCP